MSPYGLGAVLLSEDPKKVLTFFEEVKAGTIWINDPLTDNYAGPFGGMKYSGGARELGIDEFCETKHVHWDFLFGQPCTLIENLHWPRTWDGYVSYMAGMAKPQFAATLTNYCSSRNKGDKHHLRVTDQLARSRSPMMLSRVPVAKMFFEGIPCLLMKLVSSAPPCPRSSPC